MTDKISSGSVEDAIDVETEKVLFYSDVAPMESKSRCSRWLEKLGTFGVETRGICPVPEEERTDPQYSKALFVWLSYNLSILAFSLGTLGPIVNGLSFKTSAGVIVGFVTLAGLPPAYLATFGPKLGLRQMVQARFSFGYYGAIVPGSLEVLGMIGYSVINVILGGKILSAVSGGSLSWNVGIVVVSAGGLVISFFGGRVLTLYARVAWIPMLVVFIALIAVGAKNLSSASFVPANTPETHKGVLGFGSSIAAYTLSYSPAMSDYTNYMRPGVDSRKIFAFAHLSLVLPSVSVAMLGAAFGASLKSNPTWQAGYDAAGPGGLIAAVLEPLGGFGKFLTVLLGLSVITNLGPNMYSFCFSFQVVVPPASRVPRYVFSIMGILVLVPLAIVGAKRFETTLVGFLGIVGYWCSTFVSVLIVEHVYFRRATFSNYDVSSWETPRALPPGIAALGACTLTFGLIALCMSKAWYTGIIAKHTGDLGLEVGLILAGLLYVPLRTLEKRMVGR